MPRSNQPKYLLLALHDHGGFSLNANSSFIEIELDPTAIIRIRQLAQACIDLDIDQIRELIPSRKNRDEYFVEDDPQLALKQRPLRYLAGQVYGTMIIISRNQFWWSGFLQGLCLAWKTDPVALSELDNPKPYRQGE